MKTPLLKVALLLIGFTAATSVDAQNEPNAPSNFIATPDAINDHILLTWNDNSDNETRFIIQKEWTNEMDNNTRIVISANQTSFTDTGIEPNTNYSYTLWAENDFGSSGGEETNGIIQLATPPTPANVSLVTGSMTSLVLTFTDNSNLESGFEIKHSTEPSLTYFYGTEYTTGGVLNEVITYLINDGPFSKDPSIIYYPPHTRVYACIRAYYLHNGQRVYGPYSPVVSALTNDYPESPSNFSAGVSLNGDSVRLSWTNNTENAAAMLLGRYEGDFNPNFLTTFLLPGNADSFYDQNADPSVAYHYRLVALNTFEYEATPSEYLDTYLANNNRFRETTLQPVAPMLIAPTFTEVVGTSPQAIRIRFNEPNDHPNHTYVVKYSIDPNGPFDEDWFPGGALGQELSYETYSSYEPNTVIYIKVAAVVYDKNYNPLYYGPFSKLASATTMAGWPPSPTDFTATYEGDHVKLTWTDNSTTDNPLNETFWGIMRADDGCCNLNHAWQVPADTTMYLDYENLLPNHTYAYRLESINEFGNSYDVYYAYVTTPPLSLAAPTAKLASSVTPTSFTANWKPSAGAEYYLLDVYNVNTSKYFAKDIIVHDTLLSVIGTKSYRRYSYVVRAVAVGTQSPNSDTILVTKIKNLILNPRCSDNPSVYRRWEIINNNIVPVRTWWHVNNTNQYGSVVAQPGSTFFFTQTISGTNKTSLTHYDDNNVLHLSEKGSPFKPCASLSTRESTNEELDTDTKSFAIEAYPNPVANKFTIRIKSVHDGDVDIKIINLQGIEVYVTKASAQSTIEVDASNLKKGIYLVRAIHPKVSETIKILKD